jgi:hypothetical protein
VRTWTDSRGRQIQGAFVRLDGNLVYLSIDGRERGFPLSGFSKEDQQFIQTEHFRLGGEPGLPPGMVDPSQVAGGGRPSPPSGMPSKMPSPRPWQGNPPGGNMGTGGSMPGGLGDMPGESSFARALESMRETQERMFQEQAARQREHDARRMAMRERLREAGRQHDAEIEQMFADARRRTEEARRSAHRPIRTGPPSSFGHYPLGPSRSSTGYDAGYECLNCRKPVPDTAKVGQKCPHCGVLWLEEEDEFGRTVDRASMSSVFADNPAAGAAMVVGIIMAIGVKLLILFAIVRFILYLVRREG